LNLSRVLAVMAAVCVVAAFAIATLLPPMLPLAQLVAMADSRILFAVREYVLQHWPDWVWSDLMLPELVRPAWLVPLCLGIVLAGGAMTLASRKSVPRSHRRRS